MDLVKAVGLADLCELLAQAFAFPTKELSEALVTGAFQADANACLEDAGAMDGEAASALSALSVVAEDSTALFGSLRQGYSLLYLAPGAKVPVFPYESAFRHRLAGYKGVPALFRSPATLDVESQMKAAGVLPKNVRTEPADSVWNELTFFSYLFGRLAEAVEAGDTAAQERWRDALRRFWVEHGAPWLPAFMEETRAVCEADRNRVEGVLYAQLACIGTVACAVIERAVGAKTKEEE